MRYYIYVGITIYPIAKSWLRFTPCLFFYYARRERAGFLITTEQFESIGSVGIELICTSYSIQYHRIFYLYIIQTKTIAVYLRGVQFLISFRNFHSKMETSNSNEIRPVPTLD